MKSTGPKKSDDWYFPPDLLASLAPMLLIIVVLMFATVTTWGPNHGLTSIFYTALALGAAGAVLLFFARLPLYRQGRFFTLGPRALSGIHRKLYFAAYVLVGLSVGLLGLLLIRLK